MQGCERQRHRTTAPPRCQEGAHLAPPATRPGTRSIGCLPHSGRHDGALPLAGRDGRMAISELAGLRSLPTVETMCGSKWPRTKVCASEDFPVPREPTSTTLYRVSGSSLGTSMADSRARHLLSETHAGQSQREPRRNGAAEAHAAHSRSGGEAGRRAPCGGAWLCALVPPRPRRRCGEYSQVGNIRERLPAPPHAGHSPDDASSIRSLAAHGQRPGACADVCRGCPRLVWVEREGMLAAAGSATLRPRPPRKTRPRAPRFMESSQLLRADDAASVDAELMSSPGFSVDQLMELAGLAVATAVHKEFEGLAAERGGCLRVLVLCGPGNNGGDGLVAARHLAHFGHKPAVVYPRMGSSDEAKRLFGVSTDCCARARLPRAPPLRLSHAHRR